MIKALLILWMMIAIWWLVSIAIVCYELILIRKGKRKKISKVPLRISLVTNTLMIILSIVMQIVE